MYILKCNQLKKNNKFYSYLKLASWAQGSLVQINKKSHQNQNILVVTPVCGAVLGLSRTCHSVSMIVWKPAGLLFLTLENRTSSQAGCILSLYSGWSEHALNRCSYWSFAGSATFYAITILSVINKWTWVGVGFVPCNVVCQTWSQLEPQRCVGC